VDTNIWHEFSSHVQEIQHQDALLPQQETVATQKSLVVFGLGVCFDVLASCLGELFKPTVTHVLV